MKLDPQKVKYLVVHCAETTATMDVGAKEIDRWHRQRGWLKIGYHFVIRRNGVVETGRKIDEIGAHVEGYNATSVGVCMVGGAKEVNGKLEDDTNFTPEQWNTLVQLLLKLREMFPHAEIVGHHDLNPHKTCPTFNVKAWINTLPVKP